MGVVRGEEEAPLDGLDALRLRLAHPLADPGEHVGEERGVRPLPGEAAGLLVVEDRAHRGVLRVFALEEGRHRGKDALQVVQAGGGDELLPRSQHGAPLAHVEVQVVGEHVRFLRPHAAGQQLQQIGVLRPQQGQGLLLQVRGGGLVGQLPVQVRGQARDDEQVPGDVHQFRLHAGLGAQGQPAGHGQGTVHPALGQGPAVHLGVQAGKALPPELGALLYLKAGGVPVGGHDGESAEVLFGHPEGDEGAHAPGGEVPPAGLQGPGLRLLELGKARLLQHTAHGGRRVAGGGAALDEIEQFLDHGKHNSSLGDPPGAGPRVTCSPGR